MRGKLSNAGLTETQRLVRETAATVWTADWGIRKPDSGSVAVAKGEGAGETEKETLKAAV